MPLDWVLTLHIALNVVGLRANPDSAAVFLVEGDPPVAHGHATLRQPQLAGTLQQIIEHGPRDFYEGETAREIVRSVQLQGGLLELDDFASFHATVSEPLRASFRDCTLLAAPLPSPGALTVESLKLIEGFDLAGMGHNSAEALHVMAECFRLAFADRDAYFGDPEFEEDLTSRLLSDEYLARRRKAIDPDRAMDVARPGDLGRVALGSSSGGGGTTHLCTVDAAGNMVSLTQTLIGGLTGFGVAGNTGVLMNSSLQWFDPQPGRPNSAGPRKRPVSNMTPMIVERDAKPVLAVGAPGSRRITNAVSQVTLNVVEFGMRAQPAVSAPRIDCSLDHIVADDRIDPSVIENLRALGHNLEVVHEFVGSAGPSSGFRGFFARPAAIYVDAEGVRHGGDYPFAPGAAVAVASVQSGNGA
jgi:gamma-glutamyltranspeptidase/glutathione hydrolase